MAGAPKRACDVTKKVPVNPKFANVQSTIDTGAKAKPTGGAPTAGSIASRRAEIFKRMKISTLARLVKENEVTESVFGLVDEEDAAGADRRSTANAPSVAPSARTGGPGASVAGSVVHSVAETDIGMLLQCNLLLLDLREPDAFAKGKVMTASNYPATLLGQDKITPELYRMKSGTDKLLVLYHEDDRQVAQAATTLVQKGWDTVYVLSGGFSDVCQHYPELVDGEAGPASVPGGRPATGMSQASAATARSRATASARR